MLKGSIIRVKKTSTTPQRRMKKKKKTSLTISPQVCCSVIIGSLECVRHNITVLMQDTFHSSVQMHTAIPILFKGRAWAHSFTEKPLKKMNEGDIKKTTKAFA